MSLLDAPLARARGRRGVALDVRTLAAGLVLAFLGILLWRDTPLDIVLFHAVNDLGPAAPVAWSCLTVAGLGLSAWIYGTAFAQHRPERVAQLLWILVVGGLVAHWIKHAAQTPRPLAALGDTSVQLIGEALRTQSMPSGHSAMAGALLAMMIAERRRADEHAAVGGWLATTPGLALVALATVAIALSRLAVGAHWPADAATGFGLGLIFGALAPHAWPVGALTRFLRQPAGRIAMAAGLLVSAGFIGATPGVLDLFGLRESSFAHKAATGYPLAAPLQVVLALMALAGAWRWARASMGAAGGPR